VGTIALSAIFWVFNFLGIATQTEVASAEGRSDLDERARHAGLAMTLALVLGFLVALLLLPATPVIASMLGASGAIEGAAVSYIQIRWLGAPAVILVVAGFGALRGIQDMKSPLWIAAGVNLINVVLDWLLIFGRGPFPAMGIEGAALASVIAQWIGAIAILVVVYIKLGATPHFHFRGARRLFRSGFDLFIRTGMLTLFLLIGTRQATRIGAEAGAVHQAIRQIWMLAALFLDAFAVTGQSLVAFFLGTSDRYLARRVAGTVCLWSIVTGSVLGILFWAGSDEVASMLVPPAALALFRGPWIAALVALPVNALAFATDGIHWGTGDFRYLRNATSTATLVAGAALLFVHPDTENGLLWIWVITAGWILIRALFGMIRIWPGRSTWPLGKTRPLGTTRPLGRA